MCGWTPGMPSDQFDHVRLTAAAFTVPKARNQIADQRAAFARDGQVRLCKPALAAALAALHAQIPRLERAQRRRQGDITRGQRVIAPAAIDQAVSHLARCCCSIARCSRASSRLRRSVTSTASPAVIVRCESPSAFIRAIRSICSATAARLRGHGVALVRAVFSHSFALRQCSPARNSPLALSPARQCASYSSHWARFRRSRATFA